VARNTKPGQVTERVFAVTPTGGQIETTAGVNLGQYYACLYGGQNNPGCSGYTPQPPTGYGYLHNQAANAFASGLKVDGALTLWGAGEVAGQASRNGTSQQLSIWISPALGGTPLTQGLEGSFVKRTVPGWREVAGQVTRNGGYERDYMETLVDVWMWVPGGGQNPVVLPNTPRRDVPLVIPQTGLPELPTFMKNCGVNPITSTAGFTRRPIGTEGHFSRGNSGEQWWGGRRVSAQGVVYPHHGLDIAAIPGQSVVFANRAGVVTMAGAGGGRAGNMVIIDHGDGITTRYLHLHLVGVRTGDRVTEGLGIAIAGNTGRRDSGSPAYFLIPDPHLHFEVRYNGVDYDPEDYFNSPCSAFPPPPPPQR
jgi:murein DD-endopeptidase MepM/ murein hydrolase activator NlpD